MRPILRLWKRRPILTAPIDATGFRDCSPYACWICGRVFLHLRGDSWRGPYQIVGKNELDHDQAKSLSTRALTDRYGECVGYLELT